VALQIELQISGFSLLKFCEKAFTPKHFEAIFQGRNRMISGNLEVLSRNGSVHFVDFFYQV